ncbi:unnamed protein product [Camellia sinensis]
MRNVWTAVAHIITGVIGSGILSLAWCMAQLGWIGGSFSMLFFAFITLISAFLLSNCYGSPHPELGPTRNHSYLEAVYFNLEIEVHEHVDCVNINLCGIGIAYTITSAISVSNSCLIKGNITGVSTSTTLGKVWLVSQALGDIAFAYPYSIILIEIQDTLKSPPPENETMKKASTIAVCITTFFYLCCSGVEYAAFGDSSPGNLLTGFGFYEPYCLIDFANACIVLHLVGGYQVFSQPLFALVDKRFARKFPNSGFVNNGYTLKLPFFPILRLNLLRLCFRTTYVASTTVIAMIFPYFNQVLGVLGALNFWTISIYFPVEMYFV